MKRQVLYSGSVLCMFEDDAGLNQLGTGYLPQRIGGMDCLPSRVGISAFESSDGYAGHKQAGETSHLCLLGRVFLRLFFFNLTSGAIDEKC